MTTTAAASFFPAPSCFSDRTGKLSTQLEKQLGAQFPEGGTYQIIPAQQGAKAHVKVGAVVLEAYCLQHLYSFSLTTDDPWSSVEPVYGTKEEFQKYKETLLKWLRESE